MNHGLSDATVRGIRQVLAGFPQVEKALLYGSRAMGTYKPGSDIDLTLLGPELTFGLLARIDAALDDLLLPYEIDLSVFSDLKHPELIAHIQRVGKEFYCRQDAITPPTAHPA